jgi:hypothetical protein
MIKLMADGVRIERLRDTADEQWVAAQWSDFSFYSTFRIATNQLPDADGWIPWFGGENPAPGKIVCIKCRVGGVPVNFASSNLDWRHRGSDGDIVAYRIVKEKKWRWMYTNKHNTGTEGIYLTPLLTEKEIAKWKESFSSCAVGPRQDWTEVECE